ncbi:hypothetical protein C8R48DRAFT_668925 [Suillus tomentosus]|nr:hypothetical protein C8R48DRAFT_668925 [Suillus tomentosus]
MTFGQRSERAMYTTERPESGVNGRLWPDILARENPVDQSMQNVGAREESGGTPLDVRDVITILEREGSALQGSVGVTSLDWSRKLHVYQIHHLMVSSKICSNIVMQINYLRLVRASRGRDSVIMMKIWAHGARATDDAAKERVLSWNHQA